MERPAASTAPLLRYLSAGDVARAMPSIEERLELAGVTMRALVADAQLPPKIGVHPAPADSFAHAMPAWMRGEPGRAGDEDATGSAEGVPDAPGSADRAVDGSADLAVDGSADLLGLKWVVGFPANAARGLPAIHATVILNDARTGVPRAIMEAGTITAQRTAAISGTVIAHWGPRPSGRVAVIGAGVQARSHLPVLAHLLPGVDVTLCDRDADRLALLAAEVARGEHGSFGAVRAEADASRAVEGAALVLTLVSFGRERQSIPEAVFAPDATIVAVDYDMCVPASLAAGAALFLTDERGQFLANRTATQFAGYPEPTATIGEALLAGTPRPEGRVLVSHLGVGLADVVFADAILRAAEERGIGTILQR